MTYDDSSTIGYIGMAVFRPDRIRLQRQVDSIRSQTIREWRCVIGIDGTDAEALAAVREATEGDTRFDVHVFPANVGFYRNFERVLQQVPTSAPWVALADQDDEWFPNKLEKLIPHLRTRSLAFGQAIVTSGGHDESTGETKRRVVSLAAEFVDNQVTGSACVFRGEMLHTALPFPAKTDLAFHDHWLGVCALLGDGMAVENEALQFYVQHSGNVIGEETRLGIARRVANLLRRSGEGIAGPLAYMSDHRWGWRVAMAQAAVRSAQLMGEADAKTVRQFARGRITPALIVTVAAAVLRREAPVARSVGLLFGSLRRPQLVDH